MGPPTWVLNSKGWNSHSIGDWAETNASQTQSRRGRIICMVKTRVGSSSDRWRIQKLHSAYMIYTYLEGTMLAV